MKILLLLAISYTSLFGQWILLDPLFTTHNLESVSFRGNRGIIRNDQELFLTADYGSSWNLIKTGSSISATLLDNNTCISTGIYGSESPIHITTNDGSSWDGISFGAARFHRKIMFRGQTGWILCKNLEPPPYETGILKTTDGGTTWNYSVTEGFESIYFLTDKIGFATDLNIKKTTDGGLTWTMKYFQGTSGSPYYGVNFFNDSVGLAYGGTSEVLRTTDGGETWSVKSTNDNNYMSSFFLDKNNVWLGGYRGIYSSTNGGADWIKHQTLGGWITSIYFKNSNEGFFSNGYQIYVTTDAGNTWTLKENVSGREIFFIDPLTGYIAGDYKIYKTTNGGITWVNQFNPNYQATLFNSLYFTNPTTGWIVGNNGVINYTTDGGQNWIIKSSYRIAPIYASSSIDSDNIWLAGNKGLLLKLSNNGASFEHKPLPLTSDIFDIHFNDKDHGWINYGDKFLRTVNGGNSWTQIPMTDYCSSYYFLNNNTGWKLTISSIGFPFPIKYYTTIRKTLDGGVSWSDLSRVDTVLRKVLFTDNLNGVTAGVNGCIMRTFDGGVSWNLEVSGTNKNLYDMALSKNIFIVGDSGVVLRSEATYSNIQGQEIPGSIQLYQNYPNPFNASTRIEYNLSKREFVTIKVYNMLGQDIRTLYNGEQSSGAHYIDFTGDNLTSGVYFYNLTISGNLSQVKKMIYLK